MAGGSGAGRAEEALAVLEAQADGTSLATQLQGALLWLSRGQPATAREQVPPSPSPPPIWRFQAYRATPESPSVVNVASQHPPRGGGHQREFPGRPTPPKRSWLVRMC